MTGLRLAGEFSGADREAWAERAIAALKGRPLESLTRQTYDGIAIEPVVPRAEAPAPLPAHGPGWQSLQRIDMPDLGAANGQALDDLENGADGLCLVWPESIAAGHHGVPVTNAREMARLFEGVHLDLIRLRLNAGRFGRAAAALVTDFCEARSIDLARARLSLCLDPVGAFAFGGRLIEPAALSKRMAETFKRLDGADHKGDVFAADTRAWHGAGASEAQELGFGLATAVQYLRLLEAGGIDPEAAFPRMGEVLAADADQFLTIAKFRAARLLWARLAEALDQSGTPLVLHGETSLRMVTRHDPHVNLLRTTTAAFAAGIGGADTLTVLPFTAALGLADPFARRMARNIQSILKQESGIGEVGDPAAGSGHLETLTLALAEKGWKIFRDIERAGGLIEALVDGKVQAMIADVAETRGHDIARRKSGLTGLSEFPDLGEKAVNTLSMDLAADWTRGTGFDKPGAEVKTVACMPLPQTSLGAAFERLRDEADALAGAGRRPMVFLANLGALAEFNTRATWMKNLLAAGGIDTIAGDGGEDVQAIAHGFAASETRIACLCSADQVYERIASDTARSLKAAGAAQVLMAGRAGERQASLTIAGVDRFVFAGMDVAALLAGLLADTAEARHDQDP